MQDYGQIVTDVAMLATRKLNTTTAVFDIKWLFSQYIVMTCADT
jgi:hypothetical protein